MGLSLENITARLGEFSVTADFEIDHPAKVAVLGPSGGGKSTLLNLVAGFLKPLHGTVGWHGHPMANHPGDRPISMLFQDNNTFPHLTVWQNVGLGINPSLRLRKDDKDKIAHALVQVGLFDEKDRYPADLSGGQRSRVALARVLVQDNPILLLDEPFAALGPALKRDLLDQVSAIGDNKTILMVTHDPQDAKAFADQAIFVAGGQVRQPQSISDIFENPPQELRDYL